MEKVKPVVVFSCSSLSFGGAERQIANLANGLVSLEKYKVHLVIYYRRKQEYPVDSRIMIHSLYETENDNQVANKITKIKLMQVLLKKLNPQFVFSVLQNVSLIISLAKKQLPFKHIHLVATNPRCESKLMNMIILRRCDHIILQCEEQKEFYSKQVLKKASVIPNPITPLINYRKKDVSIIKNIVMMGRIVRPKNYYFAIDLLKLIPNQEVNLTIYGDSKTEQPKLEQYIRAKGLESRVSFKGFSLNAAEILASYDLFLMTSLYEGLPNALMEAMSAALPIVITPFKTGGKDLLGQHERGNILSTFNLEIASKELNDIMSKVTLLNEQRIKARSFINKHFTSEIIAIRYDELITFLKGSKQ
ncbi:MAG: glycosyltransferase [Erysipelotrichaceae bacterium]|jgi:glycosyltransferase involved in cell wall biosynthesis|nr:glycosyltransferase [Erysipelotrichaceae bacterium]